MNIDHYVAIVDTSILLLLLVWSLMDRCNFYLRKPESKSEPAKRP